MQAADWVAYLWPWASILMHYFASSDEVPTRLVWLIEIWISNYNLLAFFPMISVAIWLLASGVQDDVLLGLFYSL